MTIRGANYPRRPHDDYPTPPEVLDTLFENVKFRGPIFDPACGKRERVIHAAERHGLVAGGDDIIAPYRTDFLTAPILGFDSDIVTNPPFGDRRGSMTLRFIERALDCTKKYRRCVAMLLPIDFDSGKTRAHVFQHPAFAMKLVLLDRIKWFDGQSGSTNHCWCVWNWARRGGPPIIKYARINEE